MGYETVRVYAPARGHDDRRVIRPNVVVSTKNLNRGIEGQVREMNAYTKVFGSVSAFKYQAKKTGKSMIDYEEELDYAPSSQRRMYIPPNVYNDESNNARTVNCNYGIARILNLKHKPSLKQQYPNN
ncbi:hypothetical protein HBI56_225260 [Parastagonospora nodorum]|uniref:Uncharacterized protein n=2 Tax=Phaeosphaeria nodorum (strain SN15 / ATCC MYA-4574 / FGSC 10173) TaxID=321614 RepID=A0A7U2ID66_PHANO|nr:hypothetical protein SNOG_16312 [Parastagonospora nodorum SN15]KAH3904084.1 hypothetical protein HBH56_238880 [Parastagonospora nodorum]EAT76298.1 hypothetical protein SNOG_16312 [Parastagonospora nodorum SN15]KAH3921645.1 hypothetical protein HBH54_237150 [Parastagonospora nodorum]KAH3939769.1 hypothetical protein HBH53_229070 [Parastagonospora nodorum]KAH3957888.1 hypothetical protein HBH51_217620 [Parastagonospora nodorum]